jgi:hypothetical protein
VLIAAMNRLAFPLFVALFSVFTLSSSHAQVGSVPKLIWKVNRIDIGTVLEEQGLQHTEFEFTNTQDSLYFIQDIVAECGCTTVEYTRDSLQVGESGKVIVSFDPSSSSGFFSKLIVVKGNLSGTQDSLYLEGISIPYPIDLQRAYPVQKGSLGFRLRKVNMGDVFTNEPRIKYVEFFNQGDELLDKGAFRSVTPPYIQMSQVQQFVRPNERGLLMIRYDGALKNGLGYFEDVVPIKWENVEMEEIKLDIIADLFEYFAPIQKSELNNVPQLYIAQKEIDLKEISAKTIVRRSVTLTNQGKQKLEIKKVEGNCECLIISAPKDELEPGESMELSLTFDPIGRKGIDQRNIYLFTNDPVNPVQLIILKSRVE